MHLFLYGESGAGKSYAIQNGLRALKLTPKGFYTEKRREAGHTRLVLRACDKDKETTVAVWNGERVEADAAAFDVAGQAALADIQPGELVCMDELGFLESDARAFQGSVLDTLRFPCHTIGVLRDRDTPFLNAVRDMPCLRTVHMGEPVRVELQRLVRDFLRPRSLAEALGISIGTTALIGGGGKTTLLKRLGAELAREDKVILTTTTHMGIPREIPCVEGVEELKRVMAHEALCCIGRKEEFPEGKKLCPSAVDAQALLELCDHLLVEADGSRQLPFKAHAPHEPVIPAGARVISVMGASGFGKTVRESVHRPELFCKELDVTPDTPVTGALMARAAQRAQVVLINQVEDAARLAQAREFARLHKGRVVLASLWARQSVIEIWEDGSCVW